MNRESAIFRKAAWRLIPFMGLLYVVNYLDRVNVGFAALTMNHDIGVSDEAFGLGAGMFFVGYFLFEIPSNLILEKVGARLWIFRIMLSWGLVSTAMIFAHGPASFYFLRFLLGVMEAGFFPGMVLYMTYWFPASSRARFLSLFLFAIPFANVVGSPLSSGFLELDGVWHLRGWQWLFLLEGLPACLLAFVVLFRLPDSPLRAKWLSEEERRIIAARLAREAAPDHDLRHALRDPRIWIIALADLGIIITHYGFGFWLPQIVRGMGFSNLQTGFVVAIPYTVAALAMIAWAHSSDARGERIWHVALGALAGAVGFVGAALFHGELVLSLAALTLAAAGIYAALVSIWTLPSTLLGGTAAAGGIALVNSIANIGGFVGPYVMGWLRQSTGAYAYGMMVMAAGLLCTVVLILAVGRTMPVPVPVAAD